MLGLRFDLFHVSSLPRPSFWRFSCFGSPILEEGKVCATRATPPEFASSLPSALLGSRILAGTHEDGGLRVKAWSLCSS